MSTSPCSGAIVNADRNAIHGELLSYLFLDREFIDELIELGRRDGERWVHESHDAGLWQVARPALSDTSAVPVGAGPRRRKPRTAGG